jgi:integrase
LRAKRYARGTVRYDKRRGTWNYLWYDGPVRRSRRIGTKQDFPTKAAAWAAVERTCQEQAPKPPAKGETLRAVAKQYELERMPTRVSTARVYRSVLHHHVLPKWGDTPVREIQPRPVELWLRELPLAPKMKTHIRAMLGNLLTYAMWAGVLEIGVNPMSLVSNPGATRRVRKARSLRADEFEAMLAKLGEPFATLALLCVCLGLRISEALALRWAAVDWVGARLSVRQALVNQVLDDVKTQGSAHSFNLAPEMLDRLQTLKSAAEFASPGDWVFASPHQLGRLPWSYTAVRMAFAKAAETAGIGKVSTHTFRHTHRAWLDAVGTSVAVQQKMMRHTDIRTTMNIYGDVVTDEMAQAGVKVAQLAFGTNGARDGAQTQLSN